MQHLALLTDLTFKQSGRYLIARNLLKNQQAKKLKAHNSRIIGTRQVHDLIIEPSLFAVHSACVQHSRRAPQGKFTIALSPNAPAGVAWARRRDKFRCRNAKLRRM
jgi:hypothetical protein